MRGNTHGERKLSRPAANATNSETPVPASLPTECHGGHHRGPAPVVAAFRRGRDVQRAHDVPREHPLLASLIPRLVGVERDAEHGGEHRGSEILGVVTRGTLVLPVAVV